VPSPLSPPKKLGRIPKPAKTVRKETPIRLHDSDETVVDEDADAAERMGEEMIQEDVVEQQALIANLKAQRDAAMENGYKAKRGREEAEEEYPKRLNFQEPEIGERAIASNRRVGRFHLEPRQKSLAWGVAAFAFGLGAVYVLS
jgi:hypothetical protein